PLALENVDLLSASGHKIYGPKGVGFLYRRKGVGLEPLLHGGGHEKGLRSGTENVPGIVGLAAATELMAEEQEDEIPRQRELRDKIIEEVLKVPDARLNGPAEDRLANNANFSFKGIEGESIVMKLDNRNIAASTGSACSSPSLEPSHVLLSIGLPLSLAHGSLRITLGRETSEEDVEYLLEELPEVVDELRRASPLSK
ncbi:MAG: cysteine desulfurase family protein, partial [Candidatus Bipolaricaulia bacterium]